MEYSDGRYALGGTVDHCPSKSCAFFDHTEVENCHSGWNWFLFLQAGFTLGIFLTFFVAGLEFYTCALILRLAQAMRNEQLDQDSPQQVVEFSDLCRYFIGPRFAKAATVVSVVTSLTASIAYWILMSGFLFDIGRSIFGTVNLRKWRTKRAFNITICATLQNNIVLIISTVQSVIISVFNALIFCFQSLVGRIR